MKKVNEKIREILNGVVVDKDKVLVNGTKIIKIDYYDKALLKEYYTYHKKEKNSKKKFSTNLRKYTIRNNIERKDLSKSTGINLETLNKYYEAKNQPANIDKCMAIAKELKISLNQLLEEDLMDIIARDVKTILYSEEDDDVNLERSKLLYNCIPENDRHIIQDEINAEQDLKNIVIKHPKMKYYLWVILVITIILNIVYGGHDIKVISICVTSIIGIVAALKLKEKSFLLLRVFKITLFVGCSFCVCDGMMQIILNIL